MFQKVKTLFLNLAIYGMGDVATHLVGFLLLPLFTRFLTKDDYGVWNLLLTASLMAKIVFRWGVDAAFMRFLCDCDDQPSRQRLASTILFFLLAANGVILLAALLTAPLYAEALFGVPGHTLALQLMLASTFVGGFFFLPFHVFRIQNQAKKFSALTFARSTATLGARVLLVMGLRFGVMGLVWSEFVITLVFAVVLARWFAPLIRPVFSRETLREVLRFGLPRVPHGLAQQVVGPTTDAFLLRLLLPLDGVRTLQVIGVYGVGASIGLALKMFLSAFEFAWAPFYFQTMKEADARRTFSTITTYGFAVLVFLAAGMSAVSTDLVRLMTAPRFHEAAVVIPWITIAVTLQGVYLLTSIGMNITKHTEYYPIAAGAAAATNVVANILLIPRFEILGPAVANVMSYAVLAAVAFVLSQRLYPIRYEWGRLARVVGAGIAAYLAAVAIVPSTGSPMLGVVARGAIVAVVYPGALAATGFLHARELGRIRMLVDGLRMARGTRAQAPADRTSEPEGAGPAA